MKKIASFLKWHWLEMGPAERAATIVFGWILPCMATLPLFGLTSLIVCFFGLVTSGLSYLLWQAAKLVRARWTQFNNYTDFEHQRVIDKLAGKRTRKNPYTNREHDFDTYA